MVQTINNISLRGTMPKLEDIVFTKTDASWVHDPHEDALVVTTEITNSLIFYWGAYWKIRQKRADLHPTTSPLYGFTGESVIPEGKIKLVVILGEAPRMTTIVTDFLMVNCWVSRRTSWRPGDPNKPSRVIKISKGLNKELAQ